MHTVLGAPANPAQGTTANGSQGTIANGGQLTILQSAPCYVPYSFPMGASLGPTSNMRPAVPFLPNSVGNNIRFSAPSAMSHAQLENNALGVNTVTPALSGANPVTPALPAFTDKRTLVFVPDMKQYTLPLSSLDVNSLLIHSPPSGLSSQENFSAPYGL